MIENSIIKETKVLLNKLQKVDMVKQLTLVCMEHVSMYGTDQCPRKPLMIRNKQKQLEEIKGRAQVYE